MRLRTRILLGFVVAIASMGSLVALAIVRVTALGRASDAILSENYASILAVANMLDALQGQEAALLQVLAADPDDGLVRLRAQDQAFRDWLGSAERNVTVEGEAEVVRTLSAAYEAYRTRVEELLAGDPTAAAAGPLSVAVVEIGPRSAEVRRAALELRRLNEGVMYGASERAAGQARRSVASIAWATASVVLLATGASVAFADRVVRPVRQLTEATRRVAAGDYAVSVPVRSRDELGGLARDFNRMARELASYQALHVDELVHEKGKLEAVLAGIDDGLVLFDAGCRVVRANPAARRLLDLDSGDLVGRSCGELLPFPAVCDLVQQAVESGQAPVVPEDERLWVFATRGGHKHCQVSVTPILVDGGRPVGSVLLLRDLTRLMDLERLKAEFVTAASHELRTPLTSVQMSVDLLLERIADGLAERDRELLQAAHEEVHRMTALIEELLDLSRIEAGRIELAFADVAVGTLFDHVTTIFGSQLEEKHVTLDVEAAPGLPLVRVDPTKATWVLTNLVSNALRYVGEGGHVALTARSVGRFVQVSVIDDGPGIPAEVRDRIFEKFARADGSKGGGGSGLGLAICKEIVRAHGGTIWVASTSPQGTTFTFTLPLAA